jgi:hypothetical protein
MLVGMGHDEGAVTDQAREWAVATIRSACGQSIIDIDETEDRLGRVFAARTLVELYAAIAGLPHPPPPLVFGEGR